MIATPLFGRDAEASVIADYVTGARQGGRALVVRGEAGIGKTALLDAAIQMAADQGLLVLRASGVQSEANVPFAGLHQLLRPILTRRDNRPALRSPAIDAAFGMAAASAPELFQIALATLELLSEVAVDAPILLAAEDAQWLDQPTADVLTFIGRRIESDPVILLAAIREGYENSLLAAGLPELRLEPLSDPAAIELLNSRYPDLAPAVRGRLLDEAEGNPLALLELPTALAVSTRGGEAPLPAHLPLTVRLEQAFAARAAELPDITRALLRIASADDKCDLTVIMRAAELAHGVQAGVKDLVPAMQANLIEVNGRRASFRHPLVRSAIYQAASFDERVAAHAALAEVLADDLDRRVWHRAAAAVGADPAVAAELEEAARRALDRGGLIMAATAFERAADFARDQSQQGALLLRAAEAASELGRSDLVSSLLLRADALELGPRERARSMWLGDAFRPGPAGDPSRIQALVETARQMIAGGETDLALKLVLAAAFRCNWGNITGELARDVLQAADDLCMAADDPRLLEIQAYVAPVTRGAALLGNLRAAVLPTNPDMLYLLGTAACMAGAYGEASNLLGAAATGLREQGRLRLLAQVLHNQSWSALMTADFDIALPAAEEAARLAAETAQPLWLSGGKMAEAVFAALRGDETAVGQLTAEAESIARPAGASVLLATALYVRSLLALGQGRHAESYGLLRRLDKPGDPARHHLIYCFNVGDLAEAAIHCGHRDEALIVMRQLEPIANQTPSPWFQVSMLYARTLLADDEEAFKEALLQDLTSWPFVRARLQLSFGEWLRRHRRTVESRGPLRTARGAFDALGLAPWAERARRELQAAGENSQRRLPRPLEQLTPQELQIMQLAADGLSNREIAQRLYLSTRTIESHLYRVFPKLGITSRSQLSSVLSSD